MNIISKINLLLLSSKDTLLIASNNFSKSSWTAAGSEPTERILSKSALEQKQKRGKIPLFDSRQLSSFFQHCSRPSFRPLRDDFKISFWQHQTTFFCSWALSIILSHYLSICLNFLDSVGIALAISPAVNTETRLIQSI